MIRRRVLPLLLQALKRSRFAKRVWNGLDAARRRRDGSLATAFSHNNLLGSVVAPRAEGSLESFRMQQAADKGFADAVWPHVQQAFEAMAYSPTKVLDVGCGRGLLVSALADRFPETQVFGSDLNPRNIAALQRSTDRATFFVGDIFDVPYEHGPYDAIVCTEVLEHLIHPEVALRKLVENLKPEGLLFVSVPDGRWDSYFGHINFWSTESWSTFMQKELADIHASISIGPTFGSKRQWQAATVQLVGDRASWKWPSMWHD